MSFAWWVRAQHLLRHTRVCVCVCSRRDSLLSVRVCVYVCLHDNMYGIGHANEIKRFDAPCVHILIKVLLRQVCVYGTIRSIILSLLISILAYRLRWSDFGNLCNAHNNAISMVDVHLRVYCHLFVKGAQSL